MRTDFRIAVATAALLLSSSLGARADSDRHWNGQQRERHGPREAGFTVSGIYNGTDNDRITIGERNYAACMNLKAYLVGDGLEPLASVPAGSHVFAWGIEGAGDETIILLIVRPPDETNTADPGQEMSPDVRIRGEDEPR